MPWARPRDLSPAGMVCAFAGLLRDPARSAAHSLRGPGPAAWRGTPGQAAAAADLWISRGKMHPAKPEICTGPVFHSGDNFHHLLQIAANLNPRKIRCKSTMNRDNHSINPQACQQHAHKIDHRPHTLAAVGKTVDAATRTAINGHGNNPGTAGGQMPIPATDTHLYAHAIGGCSDPYDVQLVGCTAYEKRALCAVFHKISHLI